MSIHIRDIHIRNLICNTNKQERLNGVVRWPLQVYARGINKEELLIFRMAVRHYNYIKQHGGIGGRTPIGALAFTFGVRTSS